MYFLQVQQMESSKLNNEGQKNTITIGKEQLEIDLIQMSEFNRTKLNFIVS